MKKLCKNRQNSGITLIALVVTIIVLLILAGVAIATLTGDNGLLTKATGAKNTANEAEIGEKIRLAYQDYYLGQHTQAGYSFQDALNSVFGTGVATATGPDSNGVYTVSVNGKTYTFDPATKSLQPATAAWTQNADGSYSKENITLHVGDQVNYDPTLEATGETTYTSLATTSGVGRDQAFDAATYKNAGFRWRVLDVKNGKIRLIADTDVGPGDYSESATTYHLHGQAGYINGVSELNKISGIFGHGKGAESATSVTVDDINSITGYNPNSPKYNEGSWSEYGNKVTYTRGSGNALSSEATNGKTWSGSSTFTNYFADGSKTLSILAENSSTPQITSTIYYKNYNNDVTKSGVLNSDGTFSAPYELLFGKYMYDASNNYDRSFKGTREHSYWLASEYVSADNGVAIWGLRHVSSTGVHGNYGLYVSDGIEGNPSCGVRPVVSLKSNVNIQWNATANEWQIQ